MIDGNKITKEDLINGNYNFSTIYHTGDMETYLLANMKSILVIYKTERQRCNIGE